MNFFNSLFILIRLFFRFRPIGYALEKFRFFYSRTHALDSPCIPMVVVVEMGKISFGIRMRCCVDIDAFKAVFMEFFFDYIGIKLFTRHKKNSSSITVNNFQYIQNKLL